MKDILSRNWMLGSERELAQYVGSKSGKPNMSWTTFREKILNTQPIRKDCPISSEALYTELKWGGAKDGKMTGYKIPKEEKLNKMLKVLGYKDPVETETIVSEVELVNSETLNKAEQEESIPTESDKAKEVNEIKNPLAAVLLKFCYSCSWKINGSDFKRKYCVHPKKVHEANDYLVKQGIFETNGCSEKGVRYHFAISGSELLEFYPWIKQSITEQDLIDAGIKTRQKEHVPMPWESVRIESVHAFLDNLKQPYDLVQLAHHFEFDSANAVALQNHLLDKGVLAETRSGIAPTYLWQEKAKESNNEVQTTESISTGKDIVIEGSKVRIINTTGKEIEIVVKDNEIVLKV